MAEDNEPESTPDPAPAPAHAVPAGAGPVRSRRNSMAMRLVGVAVALVLTMAVAFAAVVLTGPPSVEDLRREAGLDDRQQLLIGVKDDQPGIAVNDNGVWKGFDIDIAYLIAADLGFRRSEVRFVAIESEDRARRQATETDGRRVTVDLVIASYSITPEREADPAVSFSVPYLSTEQSVVTLADHRMVSSLEDLRGERVCTIATATSVTAAAKAGARMERRNKISQCFQALDKREVDAVSTDAAILAGFKLGNRARYAHFDIGLEASESWGVNVGDNEALRDLVNLTLYRSREDPTDVRWEEAFERNLAPAVSVNLPAPIAVDQQPETGDKPEVREWPWERVEP
jgi:glutamate transport system substrate-binding protein